MCKKKTKKSEELEMHRRNALRHLSGRKKMFPISSSRLRVKVAKQHPRPLHVMVGMPELAQRARLSRCAWQPQGPTILPPIASNPELGPVENQSMIQGLHDSVFKSNQCHRDMVGSGSASAAIAPLPTICANRTTCGKNVQTLSKNCIHGQTLLKEVQNL